MQAAEPDRGLRAAELLDGLAVAIGYVAALAERVSASGGVGVARGVVDGDQCGQPSGDCKHPATNRIQGRRQVLAGQP